MTPLPWNLFGGNYGDGASADPVYFHGGFPGRENRRLDCFDTISLLSACRQHPFEVFQRLASSFRHMAQNKNKPGRADPTVQ